MFDRLYGNEKFKRELKELSKSGKIPQAIIIEGEKGLGRHIAAGLVAAAAICEGENPPCLKCNNCRLATELGHSDIRVFKPEKKTFTVDLAREARSFSHIKPLTAKRSVLILENTETMNNEAQNSLLKVLEEPPETAVFILITENASLFLPTVLSRCTVMSLYPVSEEEAYSYLSQKTDFSEEEILSAVSAGEGNIGKAVSLLSDKTGVEYKSLADRFYTSFCENDLVNLLKTAYSAERSEGIETVLSMLYERLFSALKHSVTFGGEISDKALLSAAESVKYALTLLKINANKSLVLNTMCYELKKAREF